MSSAQVRPAMRSLLKRATTVSGVSLSDFMREVETPAAPRGGMPGGGTARPKDMVSRRMSK